MDRFSFILVVEADDALRGRIERYLVLHGCFVMGASTLALANELSDENDFDAIIASLTLPDGTSCDLMRKLNAKSSILGVSLSPHDDHLERFQSKLAGFSAHLIKPVDLGLLVHQLWNISE